MQTKICKKCGKELPIDEFSKNSSTKDGYLSTCKMCRGTLNSNTPEFIHCPVCDKTKPYWEFRIASHSCTGRMWACKECIDNKPVDMSEASYRKKYDTEFHEKVKKQKRESHKRNIIHNIWRRAKQRAEKYGYDFNIEETDIIIPKMCPLLEIPIEVGSKDDYENSPSLDRIDNNKGYIKGNVWVISKKANSMKNSATQKELDIFCKNILRYSLNIVEQENYEIEDKEPL